MLHGLHAFHLKIVSKQQQDTNDDKLQMKGMDVMRQKRSCMSLTPVRLRSQCFNSETTTDCLKILDEPRQTLRFDLEATLMLSHGPALIQTHNEFLAVKLVGDHCE